MDEADSETLANLRAWKARKTMAELKEHLDRLKAAYSPLYVEADRLLHDDEETDEERLDRGMRFGAAWTLVLAASNILSKDEFTIGSATDPEDQERLAAILDILTGEVEMDPLRAVKVSIYG